MSRNRSTGTRSTERRFRSLLMRSAIKGWKLGHDSGLPGSPDIVFLRSRVAIFVDGCFWHGCRQCRSIPSSNHAFWSAKIQGTKRRDRQVALQLRGAGWAVLRFWEHELSEGGSLVLQKVVSSVSRRSKPPVLRSLLERHL